MNTPAKVEFEGLHAEKPKGRDIGDLILKARVAAVAALPAFLLLSDAS